MNNNGRNQTISIRLISATFVVVALGVFKPFGLDTWQWQAYIHLFFFWVIGVGVCLLTDLILKYLVRMPRSYDNGVSYIIRRNLWFQCINTPLVATFVCLYRHFVLNNRVEGNQLSLVNFIETLLIITFCSFTIGLYWRFKFRSKFLAVPTEETAGSPARSHGSRRCSLCGRCPRAIVICLIVCGALIPLSSECGRPCLNPHGHHQRYRHPPSL